MDLSNLLSNVKPQEDVQEKRALPPGSYDVKIEKVEGKTNEQTGAKGISLQLRVFGEEFNNYVLFDYMLISGGSEKALTYSLPKLKKLGVLTDTENASLWVGKDVRITVSVDKQDAARNIIWGYSQVQGKVVNAAPSGTNATFNVDEIPF